MPLLKRLYVHSLYLPWDTRYKTQCTSPITGAGPGDHARKRAKCDDSAPRGPYAVQARTPRLGRESFVKTILVAYDDTEPSRRALERAASLAEAFGSRVLVTSLAPLHYCTPRLTLTVKERGEGIAAREEDMQQAQAILQERGTAAEGVPAMGNPAPTIAKLAQDNDVDLIVVGTRSRRPSAPASPERQPGGVAEGALRRAHRPRR